MNALEVRRAIRGQVDVEAVTRESRALAASNGFGKDAAAEVGLIVSELVQNVLVHSIGSEVGVSLTPDIPARVIVEAIDDGPGLADVPEALRQGYSTTGSLGHGLPIVKRLSDSLEISTGPAGTQVTALRSVS